MTDKNLTRRKFIGNSGLALLGMAGGYGFMANKEHEETTTSPVSPSKLPFRISLNTSTIRSYNLKVEDQIVMVADAGYNGIELWVRDVQNYIGQGGTAEFLAQKMKDRNLVLENMIGFAPWFGEDPAARERGVAQLKQEMELTAKLGGKYIAAPVQGVTTLDKTKFGDYADRFRTILELSDTTGVVPIMELWGHAALNSLAEAVNITIATGHPKASLLLDFYHLYRGGNSWGTLDCLNFAKMPVFHINDYPGSPARELLKDGDRVFPGDGVCPFNELIPRLYNAGFRGGFSLELFNQGYWDTMDAKTLLKMGYDKTLRVLENSMSGLLT